MKQPRSIPFTLLNALRLCTAAICLLIAATGLATVALTISGHECSLIASIPSTSSPVPWARLRAKTGWISLTYIHPHRTSFTSAIAIPILTNLSTTRWIANVDSCSAHRLTYLMLEQWSHPVPSHERLTPPGSETIHSLHCMPASLFLIPGIAALITPMLYRRFQRSSTELCISCRYNREGLPPNSPCPECGKPVHV